MSRPIASAARTKEILAKYQLRAKKGYGQNFLIDLSVAQKCAASFPPGQAVIEIGPGIGSLSEQLAAVASHVTAFEIDEHLKPVLQDTLQDCPNVEIIFQDFLSCDLKRLCTRLQKEYGGISCCANLPYYITSPVLFKLFEEAPQIATITVMVQKEVADRFAAAPGSSEYGALSVESQYLYQVQRLCEVPRTCFLPAPKVASTVVLFTRRQPAASIDLPAFFALVRACFRQRRKTIYNNLREYGVSDPAALLQKADIVPSRRAQQLTPAEFERLYQEYRNLQ